MASNSSEQNQVLEWKRKQETSYQQERKKRKLNTLFSFNNSEIQVIFDINGTVYFKGTDIANAIGLVQLRNSIHELALHRPGFVKKFKDIETSISYFEMQPEALYFNENGLTYLLIRSHKTEEASKFHDWILDEVLPSIHTNETTCEPQKPYEKLGDLESELKRKNEEISVIMKNYETKLKEAENIIHCKSEALTVSQAKTSEISKVLKAKQLELKAKNSQILEKDSIIEQLQQRNTALTQEKEAILRQQTDNFDRMNAEIRRKDEQLEQQSVVLHRQRSTIEAKNAQILEKDSIIEQLQQRNTVLIQEKEALLRQQTDDFNRMNAEIRHKDEQLEQQSTALHAQRSAIETLNLNITLLEEHAVVPLNDSLKHEYLTIVALNCEENERTASYYAIRTQKVNFRRALRKLKLRYPNLNVVIQFPCPNSVNLYNRFKKEIPGIVPICLNQFNSNSLSEEEMIQALINLRSDVLSKILNS